MNKTLETLMYLLDEGWDVSEELEEVEGYITSSCSNCLHSEHDKRHPQFLRCGNESEIMPYEDGAIYLHVHNDFCCNQWLKKQ